MKCTLLPFNIDSSIYRRRHELTFAPALQTLELIHGVVHLAHDVRLIAHNAVCSFRGQGYPVVRGKRQIQDHLERPGKPLSNFEATADLFIVARAWRPILHGGHFQS